MELLRASSMCWSAGDAVVSERARHYRVVSALARAKRHQEQDQTRQLHRSSVSSHRVMWVQYLSASQCPANAPPCPAHSVICLLLLLLLLLALSRAQSSILVLLSCARPPNAEQRASARSPTPSLSCSSFAPHRMFLALRIAVLSAVWPLLLLAVSCLPPSPPPPPPSPPRDCCESGHCKPRRFLSRAAVLLRLSVLPSVRVPAPAVHHRPFLVPSSRWLAGLRPSGSSTSTSTPTSTLSPPPRLSNKARPMLACMHPLVLYYCRPRDSSCMMPAPPSTRPSTLATNAVELNNARPTV